MKTFIDNLVPELKEKLSAVMDADGPQAAFDQYVKTLPQTKFTPWKYPYLWGEDAELSAPIAKLAAFMSNDKSEQSGEYWADYIENTLAPIARDAAGADMLQQPLEVQLYACELAYVLALAFPTWTPGDELIRQARKAIVDVTESFFDEAGMPCVEVIPYFRSIVASWTRLRILENQTEIPIFPEREKVLYEWLVRNMILLTNPDSTQRFGQESKVANPKAVEELFQAALSLDSDVDDAHQAMLALPWISQAKAKSVKGVLMTEPSVQSEWSKVGVLQNDWSWKSTNVTGEYDRDIFNLLINVDAQRLAFGAWEADVLVNGKRLKPAGEWSMVCWSCEDDYAYWELELPLQNGATLERAICLMHPDDLLLVSHTLKFDKPAAKPRKLEIKSVFPLNDAFTFTPAGESTEGTLSDGKNKYNVFPLALEEWTQNANGSLQTEYNLLIYTVEGQGNGLYAPLVIDLNPKRAAQPFTWRHLTVTQTGGVIVTPDVAAGFRLQIGKEQWLIYNSMTPPLPRAVLGCHLYFQTLFSRFVQGEFDQIVAIE